MSKTTEEIISKLKKLTVERFINVPGEVILVDESKKTCIVKIDKVDYPDIRLNSIITDTSDTHSYIVPETDSWVIVSFLENSETDGFLSAFSEIKKVVIKATEFVFNDGELKGMVKIEPLITKLNNVEKAVNSLKQVFSSWTPVAQDGGAALKAAVASWANQQLTETKIDDLENPKIKQ